jgi:D-galactarolactone cycloisomerase
MLITRIEPIRIAVPFDHGGPTPMRSSGPWTSMDALLVRVDTDAGISGWGEAFGFAASPVTEAALNHVLAPLCIGKDPEQLSDLIAMLRRSTVNMGTSGPVRYALSGIEIALWDIAGKIEQQPLHALLGGAKRTKVPAYASFLPYHDVALVERNVDEARRRGYRHIKLHERTVDTVAAARRVGGADLTLMVDTNCAWPLPEAVEMARKFEPFDLAWLEEPIYPPDDFAALASLRAQTSVPIAFGENIGNVAEARRAFAHGACDIVQPSAIKIGGVSEMLATVHAAEAAGVRAYPHSPFFGPAIVATLHVLATLEATRWCERFYCELEGYVLGDAVAAVDGMMAVPQGPGLGIKIDETLVARYRVSGGG